MKVTISQHFGGNGSYCSRPLLNPSHWDSADWMRLSPLNYGHTHLLWKKLASFIFQGNKKTTKTTKHDIKELEGSDLEWGYWDEADAFSFCDVWCFLKCHNAGERRGSEVAAGRELPQSIMGRHIQWLPPSFTRCGDIKTNAPRLSAFSCLHLAWCSASRLPWIQVGCTKRDREEEVGSTELHFLPLYQVHL